MPDRTPGFLAWSLQRQCELREFDGWDDPLQIERALRPVRAIRRAQLESRIDGDICIQPFSELESIQITDVMGFRVSEALEFYGGDVSASCNACPANAFLSTDPGAMAGCYGFVTENGIDPDDWSGSSLIMKKNISELAQPFLDQHSLERSELGFFETEPSWHGLWMKPIGSHKQLMFLRLVLESVLECQHQLVGFVPSCWQYFHQAISNAINNDLMLRVDVYPSGEVVENNWFVDSHCPRCKISDGKSEGSPLKNCTVCGYDGTKEPRRKRFVRGKRPYWEIVRFLGIEQTRELLSRYKTERGLITEFFESEDDS